MNSKQERLRTAYQEYQKIKDAALISYTEILDIAHTAYRKIKDEIEADGEITICQICKKEIKNTDLIALAEDAPTLFSTNNFVHKSCKILSSEPKEQL